MTTVPGKPVVLDYATTAPARPRWFQWVLLALSLPALAAPFMDFYWGISPLDAIEESFTDSSVDEIPLALMGFGFFTAFPAIAWRMHVLLGEPGRRARRAYLALALLAWTATVWLNVLWCREVIRRVHQDGDALWATLGNGYPFLVGIPVAIAGLLVAWRLTVRGNANRAFAVALTTPYLANSAICLVGFADSIPSLGYLFTLLVAVIWTVEIAADVFGIRRWRGRQDFDMRSGDQRRSQRVAPDPRRKACWSTMPRRALVANAFWRCTSSRLMLLTHS